jgi:Tfp pilus assembly protein PilX
MATRSRHHQRGLGTVAISLILLFALSMLVLYFNRHVLFEQRTAINQARAMQSHALAQGGLDWAVARLNDHRALQASCAMGVEGQARELVLATAGAPLHAACTFSDGDGEGGDLACHCAANTAVAAWPAHDAKPVHGFTVQLSRHADDAQAVQIVATGCVNATAPCAGGDDDALARLHLVVRAQPLLWRRPVAPLVASGGVQACASASISNPDSRTPGWWAHAGGEVAASCAGVPAPATVFGVAGSVASYHGGDSVLAQRGGDRDTFFATWFGTPIAHYRAAACRPTGDTPGVRGSELRRLLNDGCRRFIVDEDITFDADITLGSADDPVALVFLHRAVFSGAAAVHGLVYADAEPPLWGQLRWRGALIARGSVLINAAVEGAFDDAVLQRLSERAAVMVAVPGSWRDE